MQENVIRKLFAFITCITNQQDILWILLNTIPGSFRNCITLRICVLMCIWLSHFPLAWWVSMNLINVYTILICITTNKYNFWQSKLLLICYMKWCRFALIIAHDRCCPYAFTAFTEFDGYRGNKILYFHSCQLLTLRLCIWNDPFLLHTQHHAAHGVAQVQYVSVGSNYYQWPLLLTWFNFNPSMDK